MTNKIGSAATVKVIARMSDATGVNAQLAALHEAGGLSAGPLGGAQIRGQNVAHDLAERTGGLQYPVANVYCEKVVNSLKEKFRSFSGHLEMAIEVRHSQDRLEGLQERLDMYADAVAKMLDGARGDWGDGMYYAGGYEVAFGAIKQGGRNMIQTAKIIFEIGVSRS